MVQNITTTRTKRRHRSILGIKSSLKKICEQKYV